jgi:hypothetical protein
VNSLTGNLQRFGFEKVAKIETLQEIIDEMSEDDETSANSSRARPGAAQNEDDNG